MSDVDALQLQEIEVEPAQTVCGEAFHLVQTIQKFLFTFTVRSARMRTSCSHNNMAGGVGLLGPW